MRPYFTCTTCRTRLAEHLQRRLPPAEAQAFARHLEGCASCRGALELEQRLRAMPPVPAPPGLAAAVLAPRTRPAANAAWFRVLLAGAAAEVAFRALGDPLLLLDLQLRQALAPLARLGAALRAGLRAPLRGTGRQLQLGLALPLNLAGSRVQAALAGPTETQPRR